MRLVKVDPIKSARTPAGFVIYDSNNSLSQFGGIGSQAEISDRAIPTAPFKKAALCTQTAGRVGSGHVADQNPPIPEPGCLKSSKR